MSQNMNRAEPPVIANGVLADTPERRIACIALV
jgi:hypothetical protein